MPEPQVFQSRAPVDTDATRQPPRPYTGLWVSRIQNPGRSEICRTCRTEFTVGPFASNCERGHRMAILCREEALPRLTYLTRIEPEEVYKECGRYGGFVVEHQHAELRPGSPPCAGQLLMEPRELVR